MNKPLIKVDKLHKTFRVVASSQPSLWNKWIRPYTIDRVALETISFNICEGESVALVGPNGAGKSTLIKILSAILIPNSGTVLIDQHVPWKERMTYTAKIGLVMGQKSLLTWDIPVRESLLLFKDIYGLSDTEYQTNMACLEETFQIRDFLHIPVRKLSLGQRMRCEIVAAVLHLPKILFLDEPTVGLDLPTKLALLDYIKELQKKTKTTVILTSHYLQEVEFLCERILIINHGKIIFDGAISELKARMPHRKVSFQQNAVRNTEKYQALQSSYSFTSNAHLVEIQIKNEDCTRFLQELLTCADVEDINIREASIEEAIRQYL